MSCIKYELGEDIYDSLVTRIDFALNHDFDDDNLEDVGSSDLLFNGDIDSWIAFANTLKLKIFIRQSEVRPDVAESGIKKLYDDKVDFLTEDAKLVIYADASGNRNPLYGTEISALGNNPNLILFYPFSYNITWITGSN